MDNMWTLLLHIEEIDLGIKRQTVHWCPTTKLSVGTTFEWLLPGAFRQPQGSEKCAHCSDLGAAPYFLVFCLSPDPVHKTNQMSVHTSLGLLPADAPTYPSAPGLPTSSSTWGIGTQWKQKERDSFTGVAKQSIESWAFLKNDQIVLQESHLII